MIAPSWRAAPLSLPPRPADPAKRLRIARGFVTTVRLAERVLRQDLGLLAVQLRRDDESRTAS